MLRQLAMVATVSANVANSVRSQHFQIKSSIAGLLGAPGLITAWLVHGPKKIGSNTPSWFFPALWTAFGALCYGASTIVATYCKQYEQLQLANLDPYFAEAFHEYFIYHDAEDLRARWVTVRPRTASILKALPSVTHLQPIYAQEIANINTCLEKDVWYLRQLAKLVRQGE